ncbi:MAG TPA: hypothetical protein VEY71_02900, partial [Chitinophagales bacterium]|nr:hypothetical protein [Chitinophagales bacterium]
MFSRLKLNDGVFFGYALVALLLPVGGVPLSWALIVCLALWLANTDWKEKFLTLRRQQWIMFPVGLYALVATGFFYSDNEADALFKLEQKL